mgnify:CR=1 FL=1
MPVIRSAGAVVFRGTPKGREYLLIKHSPPYGHWDFPKGHIEKGEKTEDAVRREAKEETGISKIEIIPGFKETVRYFVGPKEERRLKFVAWFLARTEQKQVKVSFEHQGYVWLSLEEAMRQATYSDTKKLLKKADEFLSKKSL